MHIEGLIPLMSLMVYPMTLGYSLGTLRNIIQNSQWHYMFYVDQEVHTWYSQANV